MSNDQDFRMFLLHSFIHIYLTSHDKLIIIFLQKKQQQHG